jgi:hypothetical protein
MLPFIETKNGFTVFPNGKPFLMETTDRRYSEVKDLVLKGASQEEVQDLVDNLSIFVKNNFEIDEMGNLLWGGEVIHNALSFRIKEMISGGYSLEPTKRFLDKINENPSETSRSELYDFLKVNSLPITEDGDFLAYKRVRLDYFDIYSKTIDNSVGRTVSMTREKVDDNKDNTCSTGLHFCSYDYFNSGMFTDGRLMVIKINPKDVVSIPADYDNAKGRCCKYEVISEIEQEKTYIKNNIVLDEELEEDDYFVDEDKDEEYFDEGVGTSRYDVFTDSPDWESRVHPVTGKKLWLFVMHKVRQNDRIVDAVKFFTDSFGDFSLAIDTFGPKKKFNTALAKSESYFAIVTHDKNGYELEKPELRTFSVTTF